jgi:hypothetical protein
MAEIHVGDIGTQILISIVDQDGGVADISLASSTIFSIEKPNGVILEVDAELYTDGTDGLLLYTVVEGDFDVVGIYKVQPKIIFSSGSYSGSVSTFRVYKNLG